MPRIMPITALRNTIEISDACHELDEPIYITKNGREDMVIMSMEVYERQATLLDIYEKVMEAEADIAQGRVHDIDTVFAELRSKYGY